MTQALLVSNALLWIVVLALAALVVALVRQIGVLHERIAPVGALARASALEVGQPAPRFELDDLDRANGGSGARVRIGFAGEPGATLVFFLSPECPVCKQLLPTLRRAVADEAASTAAPVRLVIASDGELAAHRAFRRAHSLGDVPYVLSSELGMRFGVGQLPTAVLLDSEGIVRARGLVNTREHLESLFEAAALGVASLQEHLARRDRPLAVVDGGARS